MRFQAPVDAALLPELSYALGSATIKGTIDLHIALKPRELTPRSMRSAM
jgi:hypothetical protein